MSHPQLPAELLDYIVDFLQDDKYALGRCCLVSKSWITRTRKHLFAEVWFFRSANLQSWKKTFSDPSTSPACYVNSLFVHCPEATIAADATDGGWIPTFSSLACLEVDTRGCYEPNLSLAPFHGFSHTVKTLCVLSVDFSTSHILDLACSFPLLESLTVYKFNDASFYEDGRLDMQPTPFQPSSAPAFTGLLEAHVDRGLSPLISQLLSLPIGLRFQRLTLTWSRVEDISLTMELVERCCFTLKSLSIDCKLSDEVISGSIDLSEAVNLEDVDFSCGPDPKWVVRALRTIEGNHNNFRQISLFTRIFWGPGLLRQDFREPRRTIGETIYAEWLELDRVLVKLWESHLIRPLLSYKVPSWVDTKDARGSMDRLLPEATRRKIVDLIGPTNETGVYGKLE